ncbi:hypothetical protein YC2023_082434 [Brassica napus]
MFAKGSDFIFIAFGFSHLSFRHGMSEAQSSTAEDKKKVQINKKMREVKQVWQNGRLPFAIQLRLCWILDLLFSGQVL